MAIFENVYISVCIILVGMWRSCSCLVVGVGIIPLISVVMMMVGSTDHPSWVTIMVEWHVL